MNLRRIKRKARQHKAKIGMVIGAIMLIALIVFLVAIVGIPAAKRTYEITEVDVLAMKGLEGEQVTLKGVKLGDGMERVLEAVGYPETQSVYAPDITNMEFGKKAFNLNETGVILQFKGDRLVKMTFLPAFNSFLRGKTRVAYTKDEFLVTFGKSDSVKQMPESEGSAKVIRVYAYNEGVQFTTQRGIQIALSFVNHNAQEE